MRSGAAYSAFSHRLGIDDVDGRLRVALLASQVGLVTEGNGALFGRGNAVRTVGIAPRSVGSDFRTDF